MSPTTTPSKACALIRTPSIGSATNVIDLIGLGVDDRDARGVAVHGRDLAADVLLDEVDVGRGERAVGVLLVADVHEIAGIESVGHIRRRVDAERHRSLEVDGQRHIRDRRNGSGRVKGRRAIAAGRPAGLGHAVGDQEAAILVIGHGHDVAGLEIECRQIVARHVQTEVGAIARLDAERVVIELGDDSAGRAGRRRDDVGGGGKVMVIVIVPEAEVVSVISMITPGCRPSRFTTTLPAVTCRTGRRVAAACPWCPPCFLGLATVGTLNSFEENRSSLPAVVRTTSAEAVALTTRAVKVTV